MDTRRKILTLDQALRLKPPVAIASGTFEILRAEHARELESLRARVPGAALLVAVLDVPGVPIGAPIRAEMAAALRVVDYVVIAESEELARLIDSLDPVAVARLEAADQARWKALKEHVRRQN